MSSNDNNDKKETSKAMEGHKRRLATDSEKESIQHIMEALRQQNLNNANGAATSKSGNVLSEHVQISGDDDDKKHAFWDTQPMFLDKPDGEDKELPLHAPLIPNKERSDLRQEPYNMPKGFVWSDLDVSDEEQKHQIYDLLARNYVEDDDCMFRFDYSHEFLEWALTPPGYTSAFHLGVRSAASGKLVAFISAVPATIRAHETTFPSVEINFLCVHKKLRSKRLAPVLIKEITRRVNHTGVFQAVYTAGVVLPGPISSCRYYHRSLDPKKLVEVNFTRIPPRMTMARLIKLYRVPQETSTPNLRPMVEADTESAHALLAAHLSKVKLAVEFSLDDFKHWLMPRDDVISTYVACNDKTDKTKVTDMISFYHLHSTIIGNPKHNHLRAGYSFYNVATTVELTDLMKDALTLAKKQKMDVFNALEQMQNGEFLNELKFGKGDGNLQYYLYNWCCPTMESKDVGIVLL